MQAGGNAAGSFELRFQSLFVGRRSLAFPCNAQGQVDLGLLSDRARANYVLAREAVGRDFSWPDVLRSTEDR